MVYDPSLELPIEARERDVSVRIVSHEERGRALKKHTRYTLDVDGTSVVTRRYKDFDWLYTQLKATYGFRIVPELPKKKVGAREWVGWRSR